MIKRLILSIIIGILLVSCTANRISTPTPTMEGEWENLPVMPNAVGSSDPSAQTGYPSIYRYTVDTDLDTAMWSYRHAMETTGWELLGIGDNRTGQDFKSVALWYTKGGKTVTVDIWVKNSTTYIALIPEP